MYPGYLANIGGLTAGLHYLGPVMMVGAALLRMVRPGTRKERYLIFALLTVSALFFYLEPLLLDRFVGDDGGANFGMVV